MDIQEIFGKAFDIGNKINLKVKFYDKDFKHIKSLDMTYTELGMYIISNHKKIESIDIKNI